ncbi:hypothetical protein [Nocardia arizonensis]|uniref:hypothetical protein n=1 Tax=Nocardia arizonensis TaxID=1141647 RepID=UPI000AA6D875|nr:hypothetical protein [Nocardia arizonensis]
MVARSVVTLGVSTERGAVHAVALADSGEQLPERVLLHRVARTRGDTKADVAEAVETALDQVAAEIGPEQWIAGTAVVYRDAAERRAIVTRLASGPWHSTSLVSTKSAHLSLAGMMTGLAEFDHLLICEVVPGYQSFTLVDRARSRVLAATSQSGVATKDTLGIAVTAAWDQLEAAAVRPDAVVLIGSAADAVVVREALTGFGAPVLPCPIAVSAPAAGAAMSAMSDVPEMVDAAEPPDSMRYGRGTAALLAAAGVLACGLIAGGVYTIDTLSTPKTATVAEMGSLPEPGGSGKPSTGGTPTQPGVETGRAPVTGTSSRTDESTSVPVDSAVSVSPSTTQWWTAPMRLDQPAPARESEKGPEALLPGAGVPGQTRIGAPDATMLFPGETPPPPAFTPEAQQWWDNHFRLLMQWASEQFTGEHSQGGAGAAQGAGAQSGADQVAPARPVVERHEASEPVYGRHAAGRHAAR